LKSLEPERFRRSEIKAKSRPGHSLRQSLIESYRLRVAALCLL